MVQNKTTTLTNTFIGGMNQDLHPSFLKEGEVTFRLNSTKETNKKYGGSEVNQNGTTEIVGLPKEIVSSIMIEERNWIIFFSKDNGKDTIGYVNKETKQYREILNAQEFGCNWGFLDCEWLSADYDYISGCNELKLYFSSNWTYYHVNIDEMLDTERKSALLKTLKPTELEQCGITDCTYFKSFRSACGARVVPIKQEKGGYDLMAGVYQVAIQLVDANGTPTNVFDASEPILIGSENNIPGERSDQYISIYLDNLNCAYHTVRIIIIKTIGGVTTASIVAEKHFENGTVAFNYYGTNDEESPITLEEVRVKRRTYLEGRDLFIHNNKAWYYNLKPDKNPDLQRKVFDTNVKLSVIEVPLEDVEKYNLKTLIRSERYLFGISYNIVGKGATPVYVLKPSKPTVSGGQLPNNPYSFSSESTPDEVIYDYQSSKVVRYRGSDGGGGGCTTCGGGGGCSGGTCGQAVDFRSLGNEEEESSEEATTIVSRLLTDISAIDTLVGDLCATMDCKEDSCSCDDCDCDYRHKAAELCNKDWADIEDIHSSLSQWVTGLSQDIKTPTLTDLTLKEAAEQLIEQGVQNKENKSYIAPTYTTNKDGSEFTNALPPTSGDVVDNGVDSKGNQLLPIHAVSRKIKYFKTYHSAETYPDTINCEGEYVYGDYANKPIELFEVPSAHELPVYRTTQSGVVSVEEMGNTEWSKNYINLIGLDITNIYIPTEEELGGKLCLTEPFTIVMVDTTEANRRVIAKGITHGTFEGIVNGRRYAYPKHAVNSIEKIDRFINDAKSRKGKQKTGNRFIFHSIDTDTLHLGLAPSTLKVEGKLSGYGYRYGLYAEGAEPENRMYGSREDARGCRSAHALLDNTSTMYSSIGDEGDITATPYGDIGVTYDILGITYAKNNRIITPPKGIDIPLMNRGRESSVYFQSSGLEDYDDISFLGDVLEHSRPLGKGHTSYISLLRENESQYGSLVNQVYISTGLVGHSESIINGKGQINGICGDGFIGFYSVKRTSYISDKVGDYFNIPAMDSTKSTPRTVCDTPESWDTTTLGYYSPTRLPESGDVGDAKNWAGLHTTYTQTKTYTEAISEGQYPYSEFYYPRTLNHVNHFIGESRVCPWLLQTGAGSQLLTKKVIYRNLKDLDYDPKLSGRVWDECYLPQYVEKVVQPSKAQLLKKVLIKTILEYVLPAAHLSLMTLLSDPIQMGTYSFVSPALVGGWLYLKENLLRDDKLNEMLGLPTCKTDSNGGNDDTNITPCVDNYLEYNTDYSSPNRLNIYRGMPDPYYTCNCNDIINGSTSNEIRPSRQKMIGSYLDNYLNVAPLDAILVPTKYGKVKKLFFESGRFYVHTDKQLLILQEGATAIPTTSGLSLSLSGGGLLSIPEGGFKTVPEGFIGLQDPNASYTTPFGQVFIDSKARAIYLMQGGRPERISSYGLNDFFWEKLPFDCTTCRDERQGSDYLFGVDYKNRDLYFTKKDCGCSFTLAYSLAEKKWWSFYSFIPDFYIWDRDTMFSVSNDKLWEHGTGTPQTYYGTYYPYIIEFPIKQSPLLTEIEYKSTIIDSVAFEGDNYDYPSTFNKGALYSMTQNSGIKDLKLITDAENTYSLIKENPFIRVDFDGKKYKLNDFKNKTQFGELFLTENCYYTDIATPKGLTNKEQFYDDYFIMRLMLDNPEKETKLFTKSVSTIVEPRQDS